jgi:SagB-type dehydrogenase family enzyme
MSDDQPWTAERLGAALQAQKRRLEAERRALFEPLGVPASCAWPASRVYHRDSALGPAWAPMLTDAEVEALTLDLAYKRYPEAPRIDLPHPPALRADLETIIRARKTEREYAQEALSLDHLAKLLEFGCGVTQQQSVPRRAAPSPGALYAVEAYPFVFNVAGLARGLYHYAPLDHVLELVAPFEDDRLAQSFMPKDFYAEHPPLVIAFTVVFGRVQAKYLERGYRFALLEAGHIVQNMLLAATAMDLAAAPIGGFWDEPFNAALGLDPTEEAVVYAAIFGRRAVSVDGED